ADVAAQWASQHGRSTHTIDIGASPRSWEQWVERYTSQGFQVIAPTYPGFEVEVEALRADPTPIENATISSVTCHLEDIISELAEPPILIGHSFGGTLV